MIRHLQPAIHNCHRGGHRFNHAQREVSSTPRSGCAICWPTSARCRPRACLAEFDINQRPVDIAEACSRGIPGSSASAFTSGTSGRRPKSSPPSNASGRTSRSSSAGRRSATKPRTSPSCSWPTTSSPARRTWHSPKSAGCCWITAQAGALARRERERRR